MDKTKDRPSANWFHVDQCFLGRNINVIVFYQNKSTLHNLNKSTERKI